MLFPKPRAGRISGPLIRAIESGSLILSNVDRMLGMIAVNARTAPGEPPEAATRAQARGSLARVALSLLVLFGLAFLGCVAMAPGASAHETLAPRAAATAPRLVAPAPGKARAPRDCCGASLFRGCCAHGGQSGLPEAIGGPAFANGATLTFPLLPEPPRASRALAPEPAPPRLRSA